MSFTYTLPFIYQSASSVYLHEIIRISTRLALALALALAPSPALHCTVHTYPTVLSCTALLFYNSLEARRIYPSNAG